MPNLSNRYMMDSSDLWDTYGVFLENGTDEFLKFPERKESITNNWPDQAGVDIDLSTPYFKERNMTLQCAIIANDENDFWAKYNAFITALMAPGKRMFFIAELSRTYRVIYQKCSQFTRYTRLKTTGQVAAKFTIELMEPEPKAILTNGSGVPLMSGGEYIYG